MMSGLEINNLSITSPDGREILANVSLKFSVGGTYALLGRNGCGKSTLVNAIMGSPNLRITSGQILLDGENITELSVNERAKRGIFLAHQYPVEVNGISYGNFLRTALTSLEKDFQFSDILRELESNARALGFTNFDYHRSLNVGFSGGEKKKSEILQMLALKPRFAFLDEPDSGLDKTSVDKLAKILRTLDYPTTIILISHHDKLLNALSPSVTYNLEELSSANI